MYTTFYRNDSLVYIVLHKDNLSSESVSVLAWLLSASYDPSPALPGPYIGPRAEMVTPWSTNAVEITQISGISSIIRIEKFRLQKGSDQPDPMLEQVFSELNADCMENNQERKAAQAIEDIALYNTQMGLALSPVEIEYLENLVKQLGRPLSDCEIFGFAQVNSEHCRHKIFNGQFIIDGVAKEQSLFSLIKKTAKEFPGRVLSFYNDNVAFLEGHKGLQFAPSSGNKPSQFTLTPIDAAYTIKAETHNFPTTVEPFNGAATGSGGEIRDRMAGGKGSFPLAGTACYMTSYPRLQEGYWENRFKARPWLYQSPKDILIKASNGASDYGNKFGQPLINGSLLVFEGQSGTDFFAYDKTIMLAGGIGLGHKRDVKKDQPKPGDVIVVLGGDNYRIGMGGGAVSSVDTGAYDRKIELNAVQRSNPEMQKRVYNTLRALYECAQNPIVLIHDHGAGGHINCLSELVDPVGGEININKLPLGDPSLSDLEIIGNESQERMGLVISPKDLPLLEEIAQRERAPFYAVGIITGQENLIFKNNQGSTPVNLKLQDFFGKAPKTVIQGKTEHRDAHELSVQALNFRKDLQNVLRLEHVGCKDWLTNKVDRSVSGRVALQQCTGPFQLPLNGAGVMALDYTGFDGVATAMGQQPLAGLLDPKAGSQLGFIESLTNLVFTPLTEGLSGVTLSANWMWPCKTSGEDARLYDAVEAASQTALQLGVCISTGKDSLSMTQKYPNGQEIRSPGTVIFTAVSPVSQFQLCVTPDLKPVEDSILAYINLSQQSENFLGGSAVLQTMGELGKTPPGIQSIEYFKSAFQWIQTLVHSEYLLAGQDVSTGGFITALLEMAFGGTSGFDIFWDTDLTDDQTCQFLFCEKPGLVIQFASENQKQILDSAQRAGIDLHILGQVLPDSPYISLQCGSFAIQENLGSLRRTWYSPSFCLDQFQTEKTDALSRFQNYDKYPLVFHFPPNFQGKPFSPLTQIAPDTAPWAAIIREKGTNGEREMAFSLHAAGFKVRDVTMTDLQSGREKLEDISLIVFCGGFSNSDVLGSAKGWAAAFKYHPLARQSLANFYNRPDTLSLGVCNGCQLMVLLELLNIEPSIHPKMEHNHSGRFESAFLSVDIAPKTPAVLLQSLRGCTLGIWVAHGEGKFTFPQSEANYSLALTYSGKEYPQNPNGSQYNAAGICSSDGRHLALMPHLERALMPWQWPYYPEAWRKSHQVSPWYMAFRDGYNWIMLNKRTA